MRRWGKANRTEENAAAAQDVKPSISSNEPSLHWRATRRAKASAAGVACHRAPEVSYELHGKHIRTKASVSDGELKPRLPDDVLEFHDQLRLLWLLKQGHGTESASVILGRSADWADRQSTVHAKDLARPSPLPPFISAYETRMFESGVEPFRPAILRRGYISNCAGLFEECLAKFPWEQAVMRKRNHFTGDVTKTDIESARQDCTLPSLRTGIARIDASLAQLRHDFQISDPGAYITCNWYADGACSIAHHRHDFWSAIISLGAPRVFLLDGQPLLLHEGDLLVFGSQEHGLPRMPDTVDGRISLCVFWYPERKAPSRSLMLKAPSEAVDFARAGENGDMSGLVLQALAQVGLLGEVVQTSSGITEDDEDDEDVALALERSMLER